MRFLLLFIFLTTSFHNTYSGNSPSKIHQADSYSALVDYTGSRTLVLLGEASHGTREFYTHRHRISQKLIETGSYAFVAVEGDWSLFLPVNAWVQHKPGAPESIEEAMAHLNRWPQWMWRNQEFKAFVQWLHTHNANLPPDQRVGLYGIDLYAKQDGMNHVSDWVTANDPAQSRNVEIAYRCLSRFPDIRSYLQRVASTGDHCGDETDSIVNLLREHTEADPAHNPDRALHYAKLSAIMVQQAERHYRANLVQGPLAWNTRASFFYTVTSHLLTLHNPNNNTFERGGIVWAHNTHIGDARATDMTNAGMVNIGQLARESLGHEQVLAVGFGTLEGDVLAAQGWERPVEIMPVAPARPDSWEYTLASRHDGDFYFMFSQVDASFGRSPIPHRAIGVTFNPALSNQQNYPVSIPALRYDAFIFIRKTTVLTTLD